MKKNFIQNHGKKVKKEETDGFLPGTRFNMCL